MLLGLRERLAGLGEELLEKVAPVAPGLQPTTGESNTNSGRANPKTSPDGIKTLAVQDNACLVAGASASAGSGVLTHYQEAWASIHQGALDVKDQAVLTDREISNLHSSFSNSWRAVSQLSSLLPTSLPALNRDIEVTMTMLAELENLFMEVELSLLALEDTIDLRETQERQLEERFQMALHQERRRQELQELEQQLEASYRKKVQVKADSETAGQRERQRLYGTKFKEDLQQFASSGSLERSKGRESGLSSAQHASLESIDLEDPAGAAGLEQFLAEDRPSVEQLPKDDIPLPQDALCPPSPIDRVATPLASPRCPSPDSEQEVEQDVALKSADS